MCVLLYCSGAFRDQDGGYVCVCMFRVVCARYGHLSGKQKNNTRTLITDVPSVHKKWDERSEKKKNHLGGFHNCAAVLLWSFCRFFSPTFFVLLFGYVWICVAVPHSRQPRGVFVQAALIFLWKVVNSCVGHDALRVTFKKKKRSSVCGMHAFQAGTLPWFIARMESYFNSSFWKGRGRLLTTVRFTGANGHAPHPPFPLPSVWALCSVRQRKNWAETSPNTWSSKKK